MKSLFASMLLLCMHMVNGQAVVDISKNDRLNDNMFRVVGGTPFVNVKFVSVSGGSPYFKDHWMRGSIILNDDKLYEGGIFKLDLIDNEVHYLDAKGREMIAELRIKELLLKDSLTNGTYRFVNSSGIPGAPKKGWYLVLDTGKVTLYQFFNKVVLEHKAYSSSVVDQKISTSENFFILFNNKLTQVKKLKDIAELLQDKKAALEEFIDTRINKKAPSADQFEALVIYYNSI